MYVVKLSNENESSSDLINIKLSGSFPNQPINPGLIRIQSKPLYASLSFKPKRVTSHGLQFQIDLSNHLTEGRTNGGRQVYINQSTHQNQNQIFIDIFLYKKINQIKNVISKNMKNQIFISLSAAIMPCHCENQISFCFSDFRSDSRG